jgi:hypothetical protein
MMRLSVTDLDSYLYWKGSEDMNLDALLRRLRREEPPTPAMLAGTAFHSLLENADTCDLSNAEQDGFKFRFDLESAIALPQIKELKAEHPVSTTAGPVVLVGKVDGLRGSTIIDYKLTERFDAERYAGSYQWRCYLMIFRAQRFTYEVFQCRHTDDAIVVTEHHPLTFYAYPGMEQDVLRELAGLAELVAKYVPEKAAA